MAVHAVGCRADAAGWGVALLAKDKGLLAWLTAASARELARELEQMAAITEAPGQVPGE